MKWWNWADSQPAIEAQEFVFRQWSVVIERKAFHRHIRVSLKPGEPIRVKTGLKTSWQMVEAFLVTKESWIEKHMNRFAAWQSRFPAKVLQQAEKFPFLGDDLELALVPTPLKSVFFSRWEKYLRMHIPLEMWDKITDQELQQFFPELKKFYQREAAQLISERLQIWSEKMQLFPKAVRFRNQKSRWGSCSSRGTLSINWRLIGAPLEVIDYLLIHEISHLRHLNHSGEFWNLVEQHCSHVQASEHWLKSQGASLDFLQEKSLGS